MIRVFVLNNKCVNVSSDFDAQRLESLGATEVKNLSIFKGYESEVSPLNTSVDDNGNITFNFDFSIQNKNKELKNTQTKLNALNQQLSELKESYVSAILSGNDDVALQIREQYQTLLNGENNYD